MEPGVDVPFPSKYGSPYCPSCGYKCGCCCYCSCQTDCPNPDVDEYGDEYCECKPRCHGGHEPWECWEWSVRYNWAKNKSEQLKKEQENNEL